MEKYKYNLKISNFLYILSIKIKSLSWYCKFKYYIKNDKEYLFEIKQQEHRCSGKSTALIKLAKKYKLPIIVSSNFIKNNLLKKYNAKVKIYSSSSIYNLRGVRYPIFLIDENINYRDMECLRREIKNSKFIGFVNYEY